MSEIEIDNALTELSLRLNDEIIAELKLYSKMPKHLGICSTVHRIIELYNSTPENEEKVCRLLAHVLSHHFTPESELS